MEIEENTIEELDEEIETEAEEAEETSGAEEKHPTPLRAIRRKCLDCSGMSSKEVSLCALDECPLHPFRMGRPVWRKKREISEETRQKLIAQLARAREKQSQS